jgi:hypothetical protein
VVDEHPVVQLRLTVWRLDLLAPRKERPARAAPVEQG